MNLSGLGAFLSAVPGGYQQGQDDQLQQQLLRQKIAQQQQQQRALALQLSGIGPTGPQPMPQQAPLPQPGPVSAGGGPPMPGGSPVPAGALGAPTPGATPASMPGPGGPQPQPGGQPLGGGLMNQLAMMKQRIMQANPGADPATVMEALRGAATLLQADNSQETRLMIAQMAQQNGLWKTMETIQGRLQGIEMQQAGATGRTEMQQAGATGRTEMQQAGAEQRTQENIAGRKDISQARIAAQQALSAGKLPDAQTMQDIAEARSHGDTSVMSLGWSGQARTAIMGMAAKMAKDRGSTLQAEDLNFKGQSAGVTVAGRTGAQTDIGANELIKIAPLVKSTAAKLDLGKYPTINSIDLAIQKGTGSPEAVQLQSYVQTVRNAYVQVMARGGRMSDTQRKYAAEIISGNLAPSQLSAALDAIKNEADIVKSSVKQTMQDITGGGTPASGGADGWSIKPVQ